MQNVQRKTLKRKADMTGYEGAYKKFHAAVMADRALNTATTAQTVRAVMAGRALNMKPSANRNAMLQASLLVSALNKNKKSTKATNDKLRAIQTATSTLKAVIFSKDIPETLGLMLIKASLAAGANPNATYNGKALLMGAMSNEKYFKEFRSALFRSPHMNFSGPGLDQLVTKLVENRALDKDFSLTRHVIERGAKVPDDILFVLAKTHKAFLQSIYHNIKVPDEGANVEININRVVARENNSTRNKRKQDILEYERGARRMYAFLVNHGADVNYVSTTSDNYGTTVLHFFAFQYLPVVKILLGLGADPTKSFEPNKKYLFSFPGKDMEKTLEVLLKAGLNPNPALKSYKHPIHTSALDTIIKFTTISLDRQSIEALLENMAKRIEILTKPSLPRSHVIDHLTYVTSVLKVADSSRKRITLSKNVRRALVVVSDYFQSADTFITKQPTNASRSLIGMANRGVNRSLIQRFANKAKTI